MQPQLKQFNREQSKEKVEIPMTKEKEMSYPFQWLLFKPQAHAVKPFVTNEASRNANTVHAGFEPATSRFLPS